MTKKTAPVPVAVSGWSFDWLVGGIVVLALAHFLTAWRPGIWTWGLDYWAELPLWGRSLLLLLVAAAVFPGVAERVAATVERRVWPRGASWGALAAALALFLLFRTRGYAYGDGYSFRGYLAGGFPDISGNLALMSGDLAVHWLAFKVIVAPLGGSPETVYALLSAAAGVASLAAIAKIAQHLYPKARGARWMVIGAGFSSGMAALWFGHVEAYSLVAATLLWSLLYLLRGRILWGAALWVLACVLHLLAVAFLPVLLWVMFGKRAVSGLLPRRAEALFLIGFVGWGIAGVVFSAVKPGIFVPLWASEETSYTALGLAHLSDTINLLLFVAPVGVIGLLAWLAGAGRKPLDTSLGILAVAAASLWFFSFWVDPLIGAFRDWDLIGVYGIPLSILGAALLARGASATGGVRAQWVMIGALALVHSGAFVLGARDEQAVVARVDRLVREDPHYTQQFHRGERLMSWAYVLAHLTGDRQTAIEHLRKRSIWQPRDVNSWRNLGSLHWQLQQFDSAAVCFEKALELSPNDAQALEQLGLTYSSLQRWDEAKATMLRLEGVRTLKINELNVLAFANLWLKDEAAADSLAQVSIARDPNQQEAYYYRAIIAEQRTDTVAALELYERALAGGARVEDVYLRCVRLYQAKSRWEDGARVARMWQERFPTSGWASFFLGMSYLATKQYEAAGNAFEATLVNNPRHSLAHFYLATVYRNLGQPDRAKVAAERAIELDSNLAPPYLELVYLAADANDRAAAVAATREYLKRSPVDSGMSYLQQFMEP